MEEKGSAGSVGRSECSRQLSRDRGVFTNSEALRISQSRACPEFRFQLLYREVCAWG